MDHPKDLCHFASLGLTSIMEIKGDPQEIAGLIIRDYKPPLSLLRAWFLGGVAFGGAPLDCHELRDRSFISFCIVFCYTSQVIGNSPSKRKVKHRHVNI